MVSVQQEKNNIMKKVVKNILILMLLMVSSILSHAQTDNEQNKNTTKVEMSRYGNNPDKAATDYYFRGKQVLTTQNDVETAMKYFLKALDKDPNHGASNFELAKLVDAKSALKYGLKAYESDTTNYWYQELLSKIYAAYSDFPNAINMTNKMIQTSKNNDSSYKQLAAFYFYSQQVDSAFAVIDTIYSRFGDNMEVAVLHSNMIKNLQSPTEAMVEKIQHYADTYSNISEFQLALGAVFFKLAQDEKAINSYKKVRIIEETDYRGDIAIFDYYHRRRNQNESIKYVASLFKAPEIEVEAKIALYREMIATNVYLYRNHYVYVDNASMSLAMAYPKNNEVRLLYSDHLIKKGDVTGALIFNKSGLEAGVGGFESLQLIMEIESYFKNYDSLKVYIDKGYELFPEKKVELNLSKVSYHILIKEYPEAIAIMRKEIKNTQKDSLLTNYYSVLGDLYHSSGKNNKAYKAYDEALAIDPNNIVVLNNYSYYLSLENKKLDKALAMSLIVINKEPSNSTYIDTYAWVLYKLGRYNEAREIVAKAVALDTSRSSSLVLHYGDILYKLGAKGLAETYWLKAFEYGADEKEIRKRLGENESLDVLKKQMEKKNN